MERSRSGIPVPCGRRLAAGLALAMIAGGAAGQAGDHAAAPAVDAVAEERIADSLAAFLRAARNVISSNQALINQPQSGDKGLTGEVVLAQAVALYREETGADPSAIDPDSPEGSLLRAQMAAVREVIDENQATINDPGLGFKGFVPAVFARMVNERFMEKVGDRAEIKVTAPQVLVRNRKALPDEWESAVIGDRFKSGSWPEGQGFAEWTTKDGREAFRVLVPEYYTSGCLGCHGMPTGELDITGYPKEGGRLGDLGGAISITLYR